MLLPKSAGELVFWASVCPIGLATAQQPFITLAEGGALDIPIEDTITTPQSMPSSELFPGYINKRDEKTHALFAHRLTGNQGFSRMYQTLLRHPCISTWNKRFGKGTVGCHGWNYTTPCC